MSRALISSLLLLFFCASAWSLSEEVERIEKGNLVIEGIPGIPQRIKDRMLQYQNVRSASLSDWHPAGEGILITTRFGETTQLHHVQTPGGARHQLTFYEEPVSGASMCPDPAAHALLFSKDVGGSEFYQLFYFDLDDGSVRMLTDGESRNGSALWSNQGDRFAYFSTKRNGKDWDIYIAAPERPEAAERVLEKDGTWVAVDWSPDDSKLLVIRYVSINESYYFVLDLATKELTQINASEEKIAYGEAQFSKDGRGVYLTSDEGSEFQRLRCYDLAKQELKVLTQHLPWDVSLGDLSKDGRMLAFESNENGISKLHVLDLATGKELPLPEIPVGQIYRVSFSPTSKKLGFVLNTSQSPGDVYSIDLSSRALTRWTYSEVGGLNTDNFVSPNLIHYETFDSLDGKPRQIPAFYYKPRLAEEQAVPALIMIHGGPESQARPYFDPDVQYCLNELRIAVIDPNVRGSSGFGKSYLQLDNGYKREESVKDIGALLDWIAKQPELDSTRVGVIGGSYGGYMVLAAMTYYNDRIRAGVDVVGISNFVTFLENTQSYRQDLRREEYGDERDPPMREFLTRISPTTNAAKITKPLFIAQGLNDPRVPASESEQMVEVIRKNGGEVWYMLAKDEGHGFSKKSNRDYYTNATVLFLEKALIGKEKLSVN